ncbi:MAG: hypothetical protein Q4G14_00970 [Paracoccus sp. (in: a-proteobacteria)]|uniref:hypothetical protein n=1 Tax=Paracoccus sp. TaxID=267 RepID=UPI0026E00EC1|nr:hypothetical protein [Paracoccus sp. (in: a-proteobacteria)]MDO5611799.1 hypothetical protein [Paracoccus sp. (in: a-proteobacteria)]
MTTPAAQPSRIRLALLVFAFVYPLVTLGLMVLIALTPGWPLPVRTLILVPLVVCAMIWGIIPLIHRRLHHLL